MRVEKDGLASTVLAFFAPTFSLAQENDTRAEIREFREKLERLERKLAADEAGARGHPDFHIDSAEKPPIHKNSG